MNAPTPQEIDQFVATNYPDHSAHGWTLDSRCVECRCGEHLARFVLVPARDDSYVVRGYVERGELLPAGLYHVIPAP